MSFSDRPTMHEFIAAVRQYLSEEVAPEAPNRRARFRALIAANVLAIAERDLALGPAFTQRASARLLELGYAAATLGEQRAAFAAAIRSGEFDAPQDFERARTLLLEDVRAKLEIGNPKFLARYEI